MIALIHKKNTSCHPLPYDFLIILIIHNHDFQTNIIIYIYTPSGKRLHNYGKSPFLMGKLTISMAMFNSFLYVYQRVDHCFAFFIGKPSINGPFSMAMLNNQRVYVIYSYDFLVTAPLPPVCVFPTWQGIRGEVQSLAMGKHHTMGANKQDIFPWYAVVVRIYVYNV